MEYLVILLLGLLAQRSYAQDMATSESVDYKSIPTTFEFGGFEYKPPPVEKGLSTYEFQSGTLKASSTYGILIMASLYCQAEEAGRQIIKEIDIATRRLQSDVQLDGDNAGNNDTERALTVVTNQLERFLKMNPGSTSFDGPELPPIPEQDSVIRSPPDNRPLEDFVVDFPTLMYQNFESVYGAIRKMYLEGWRKATEYFEPTQEQFREQILNRRVMCAFKDNVYEIYYEKDAIRRSVQNETWYRFEEAAERVLAVPDKTGYCIRYKCPGRL